MDEVIEQLSKDIANKPIIPEDDQPQHPRFADFKNEGKFAESQRRRRQEHLDRQAFARDERLNRYRELCDAEGGPGGDNPFRSKKSDKKSPYANQLMLSDWLIDIPCALSTEWTMLPSPIGKRCLVVAQKGDTALYNKAGRLLTKFQSKLPGGAKDNQSGSTTILDCIWNKQKKKIYILDVIYWNNNFLADSEFACRRYILQSRVEENAEKLQPSNGFDYEFMLMPSCACSKEEIAEFMKKDFDFRLDGLLFYYSAAHYIPEQTPLVGWLKPWMLPEILGVQIPESYKEGHESETSIQFIEKFNEEHKHLSSTEKQNRKLEEEAKMQEA